MDQAQKQTQSTEGQKKKKWKRNLSGEIDNVPRRHYTATFSDCSEYNHGF